MRELKTRFIRSRYYHFAPSTDLSDPILALSIVLAAIILNSIIPIILMIIAYFSTIISGMFSEAIQNEAAISIEENNFYKNLPEKEKKELEIIFKELFQD